MRDKEILHGALYKRGPGLAIISILLDKNQGITAYSGPMYDRSITHSRDYPILGNGGYGEDAREIIVTREKLDAAQIGEGMNDPGTRVMILPDEFHYANSYVLRELNLFMRPDGESPERLALQFSINFVNGVDFEENLRTKLQDRFHHYNEGATLMPQFRLLQNDLVATRIKLGRVFDFSKPFVMTAICSKSDELDTHTDFGRNADRRRAIRGYGPLGTLFAPRAATRTMRIGDADVHAFLEKPAHAGAGLSVVRGDAVHSLHPSDENRWIVTFDGFTLEPP